MKYRYYSVKPIYDYFSLRSEKHFPTFIPIMICRNFVFFFVYGLYDKINVLQNEQTTVKNGYCCA